MYRNVALFSLAMVILFSVGCATRGEQLKDCHIMQENYVHRIEQVGGVGGLSGWFKIGLFKSSAKLNGEPRLKIFWGRGPDEVYSTTLPYSMFKFVIDDTKEVPTVRFVFDERWLRDHRPEYTASDLENPNCFLKATEPCESVLKLVVVCLSRKDLESKVYQSTKE